MFDRTASVAGTLALGALLHTLFLTYHHHPHEFWGVCGYLLLLRGTVRAWDWRVLALVGLVTGWVWDKHVFLPLLWGLHRLRRGDAFLPTFGKGLVYLAACLAGSVATRLLLGTDRPHVDGYTTLADQEWDKVLWYQVPYVLPFLVILVAAWRRVPGWVRLLWLTAPLLLAVYVQQRFILHEVRSFWALAPVFTATLAAAWPSEPRRDAGHGPPPPAAPAS
jgi:hypothetical protein